MGNHLNRVNDLYMKLTRDDFFVDKSAVIAYLNGCISGDEGKYICVSRPTRFGMSCVADMLTAYYSRDCDSRAIFDALDIAKDPSYEKHLDAHYVIYFDVAQFVKTDPTPSSDFLSWRTSLCMNSAISTSSRFSGK